MPIVWHLLYGYLKSVSFDITTYAKVEFMKKLKKSLQDALTNLFLTQPELISSVFVGQMGTALEFEEDEDFVMLEDLEF